MVTKLIKFCSRMSHDFRNYHGVTINVTWYKSLYTQIRLLDCDKNLNQLVVVILTAYFFFFLIVSNSPNKIKI